MGKTGPVTIKGLKKGQKVALKVRSASTTGSRGISEVTNLDGVVGESTYKLGDETGDIVYDLTVIADGDATFTNSGGLLLLGLTISEEAPAAPIKVAYVYKSDYSTDGSKWTIEKDKIYPALQAAGYEVTLKDVKDLDDAALAVADVPSLLAYDVVILQEAIGSGHQYVIAMKDIINKVPFLSMKSFAYKSSVWNWGAGVNPDKGAIKGQSKLTVAEAYRSHAIFEGVTIAADGSCQIFTADNADNNLIQGYSTNDVTAADPVFATVDNNGTPVNAIHTHDDGTGKNLYLLLPWSCDDSWQSLSDDGIKTVVNGVKFLAATKASDPATGIADTKVDAAKVVVSKAYYNLSGMRVKEPTQRGIYIIREVYEDGTSAARKVLVK
ncbi:MAG: hypothetical protein LBM06_01245 [Prevotellaceae bacterium]|nr:hypothetical protein [Prevotellaceae bacterium]